MLDRELTVEGPGPEASRQEETRPKGKIVLILEAIWLFVVFWLLVVAEVIVYGLVMGLLLAVLCIPPAIVLWLALSLMGGAT